MIFIGFRPHQTSDGSFNVLTNIIYNSQSVVVYVYGHCGRSILTWFAKIARNNFDVILE